MSNRTMLSPADAAGPIDAAVAIDAPPSGTCLAPPPDAGVSQADGIFEAALRYLAADLKDLAHQAPANKRDALFAIVGLIDSLAEQ